MKKLALIGFGSLGKQFLSYLKAAEKYEKFTFFDDKAYAEKTNNSYPFEAFLEKKFSAWHFFVALGYHHLNRKQQYLSLLKKNNRLTPSWVHPTCQIHPTVKISPGCFLFPLCNLDGNVFLGNGVLLHNSVVISHESKIQDCCYLSPGVVVSGQVKIENKTFIGSGSVIANGLVLGSGVRIGLATAVTKNIPRGASVIGNPMQFLSKKLSI